ncbi:MAG: type transport system permease protein [Pseudonocardiales bacterium]|jgi:ABC-2 type transport system permease protein|nr:type transport system permease protein [Pseudonocardiales bacterium]
MIRLVSAEFLKLRTTQVWFWLLASTVAIASAFMIGGIASNSVHNSHDLAEVFTGSQIASIAVFVLGVLGVTTEFRYQTITPTVLGTPSRWAIVSAKMIAYTAVGALYAVISLGIQLAIAVPWLSAKGTDYSLAGGQVPRAMLAVFAVVALHGMIGLGVGALLRNQVVAVVLGIIFLLALQSILLAIPGVKNGYPYLPAGGTSSILHLQGDDKTFNHVTILPAWAGVIVLLLWAIVPALIGAGYTMNRDIT